MNVDRDSGPQPAHFVPHSAELCHASAPAGTADRPARRAAEDARYPRMVRAAILLGGGGALWAGVLWAGGRLFR